MKHQTLTFNEAEQKVEDIYKKMVATIPKQDDISEENREYLNVSHLREHVWSLVKMNYVIVPDGDAVPHG